METKSKKLVGTLTANLSSWEKLPGNFGPLTLCFISMKKDRKETLLRILTIPKRIEDAAAECAEWVEKLTNRSKIA